MVRVALVILVVAVAVVNSEVVEYRSCENVSEDKCTVSEVRIEPCRNPKMCRLRKAHDAQISFDYVPNFNATKMKTDVYWTTVQWADLDTDGCKGTTCPTVAGSQQQFNATIPLGKKLPDGIFEFKWQLYDESDETNKCCLKITIQLRK